MKIAWRNSTKVIFTIFTFVSAVMAVLASNPQTLAVITGMFGAYPRVIIAITWAFGIYNLLHRPTEIKPAG